MHANAALLPQANTIKFFNFKPSTAAKISKNANRFWLAGILFSITHGLLKVSAPTTAIEVGY